MSIETSKYKFKKPEITDEVPVTLIEAGENLESIENLISGLSDTKVTVEAGKSLVEDTEITKLANLDIDNIYSSIAVKADKTEVTTGLNGKVDKVSGKTLTTHDLTASLYNRIKVGGTLDGSLTLLQNSKLDKAGGVITGHVDMSLKNISNVGEVATGKVRTSEIYSTSVSGDVTFTDNIRLSDSSRIRGLIPPLNNDEAANKAYVDGEVGKKLDKTGGTLTDALHIGENQNKVTISTDGIIAANRLNADLIFSRNDGTVMFASPTVFSGTVTMTSANLLVEHPTDILSAVNKQYVDTETAKKLDKSGGTMSGDINMNGNAISSASTVSADTVWVDTISSNTSTMITLGGDLDLRSGLVLVSDAEGSSFDNVVANKGYVDAHIETRQSKIISGVCNGGGTTANKIISADSNPEAGDILSVKYTYGNTSSAVPLKFNVNSTGLKSVAIGGSTNHADARSAFPVYSGGICFYYYDGTTYHQLGSMLNSDTVYVELAESNIINPTNFVGGLISGRRMEYYKNQVIVPLLADKPSTSDFTSIEVVDEYPDVEVEGVLYLKKVTT